MDIRAYVDRSGEAPFERWFAALDPQAAAKVTAAIGRLGRGATSNVKALGSGVLEYRIDWGPGYRIYFGMDGKALIILLAGGTKRRQSADIRVAQERWADYRARRQGER